MIVLDNNEKDIVIPDYNDLENKPSINGVVLEGNKTAGELGIDIDTTNFYTKSQADDKFQLRGDYVTETELNSKNYATKSEIPTIPTNVSAFTNDVGYATETYVSNNYQPKGDYLTSVPSEYITETELDNKNYATKSEIPTIPTNVSSFNNDVGYITNSALTGYATETWVSENYQPKGDYLTSVPSEYVTETELNDAIAGLGGGESVAYLIIKENSSENTYSYVGGSFEDVVNAYNNNKPYFIYVPNGVGEGNYSLVETTSIIDNCIHCSSFAHTGADHTFRYWRLYSNSIQLYRQITYEYATVTQLNSKQDTLISGTNIKTINGNSILGSGDLTITTDLSNYYTKSEIDAQIGDINTILQNIIG